MSRLKDLLCTLVVVAVWLTLRTPASAQPRNEGVALGKVQGIAVERDEAEQEACKQAANRSRTTSRATTPG